jgi:hypothetical protein
MEKLNLGDMVQHSSGEIGMIIKINKPSGIYKLSYDVEWYHPKRPMISYAIYEWDAIQIRNRYLIMKDRIYGTTSG